MNWQDYGIFFSLAFVAEVLGTVSGFGSSILFVPLAALFFDFKIVLGITAVFHVFSNLSKIFLFREGINRDITFKLGIPAVIFVIAGAMLTSVIPNQQIELLMSIFIALLAIFLVINKNIQIDRIDRNLYAGGAVSGFLAGLIGTGGAIRGLTLIAFNLQKSAFLATSAIIDLGVDSSRALVYIYNGYFTSQHLMLIPFLIIIGFTGSYTGKLILARTSEKVFRYIVLGLIISVSLVQIIKFATA